MLELPDRWIELANVEERIKKEQKKEKYFLDKYIVATLLRFPILQAGGVKEFQGVTEAEMIVATNLLHNVTVNEIAGKTGFAINSINAWRARKHFKILLETLAGEFANLFFARLAEYEAEALESEKDLPALPSIEHLREFEDAYLYSPFLINIILKKFSDKKDNQNIFKTYALLSILSLAGNAGKGFKEHKRFVLNTYISTCIEKAVYALEQPTIDESEKKNLVSLLISTNAYLDHEIEQMQQQWKGEVTIPRAPRRKKGEVKTRKSKKKKPRGQND